MADAEGPRDEGGASTGPLASPLDALLGYRLRRASMVMMADLLTALQPLGLSAGEASLLFVIGANPGCTQSEVGRTLDIKRANMTPLVGRMKARGLIADTPIDGRSRGLTLTPQGRALQDEALEHIGISERRRRESLGIDEAALFAALRRISG